MKLLFLLTGIVWCIAMELLKIAVFLYACAAVMYGVYWLYIESAASNWIIGITLIFAVFSIFRVRFSDSGK